MTSFLPTAHCRWWGILNLTPDSFSDGGHYSTPTGVDVEKVVAQAAFLVGQGAHILDIGAESTRPGAQTLPAEEELTRLIPGVQAIRATLPNIILSIDTRKAAVAQAALAEGAQIINDVSGLQFDAEMAGVVSHHRAGLVIMHSQGTPDTMQHNPAYGDVVSEVEAYLLNQTQTALQAGIAKEKIVWDVGFGFGKTVEHNVALFKALSRFKQHGYPILAGLSRKSFLAHLSQPNAPLPPVKRDGLSTTAMALAYTQHGITDFRIHNVATHQAAWQLANKLF